MKTLLRKTKAFAIAEEIYIRWMSNENNLKFIHFGKEYVLLDIILWETWGDDNGFDLDPLQAPACDIDGEFLPDPVFNPEIEEEHLWIIIKTTSMDTLQIDPLDSWLEDFIKLVRDTWPILNDLTN